MFFKVKIADLNIGVECLYGTTAQFCGDYIDEKISNENIDFSVVIDETDIAAERKRDDNKESPQDIQMEQGAYSNEYIETLVVLRKISEQLPRFDCFLMHGAVVSADEDGYMFTATSGTGKSTHISLWKKYFDNVEIVNGDKPFLRVGEEGVTAYGTPWAGKEGWQKNVSVPLRAVCLLKRGLTNKIIERNPVAILPYIMRQVHYTDDTLMAGKTMELLNRMLGMVKVYELECDMSKEAAECSYLELSVHTRKDE